MKIAVVGSINMDMTCQTDRIPLKGETIVGSDLRYIPGGKGANQAVAIAKLGGSVEMFGCVGDDAAGKTLIENLKNNGVGVSNIKTVKGVPSGVAIITVGESDNTIVIVAGANGHVDIPYIESITPSLLTFDMVLLQHEIPAPTVEYVVDLCHKNNIKVVLNPAPARKLKKETIDKIDYLIPNEHEAGLIFNEQPMDEILKNNPKKVVITLGSKGVAASSENGQVVNIPARETTVIDTTGAGDTLNGAFTLQLAKGKDFIEALQFANVAASLSTEKFGAQAGMPNLEQVTKELEAL